MKTIHSTIRESVRKMSIPGGGGRTGSSSSNGVKSRTNTSGHMTNGQSQRPTSLTPVIPQSASGFASRTANKKRSKQFKGGAGSDIMRYSMNIEESVDSILESQDGHLSGVGGDFTRSHTLTDLNDMDLQQHVSGSAYQSGSQSTIASENSRSSGATATAKLLHTSNNPTNYSNQNIHKDSLGSPVWKPRHANVPLVPASGQTSSGVQGPAPPHSQALHVRQQQLLQQRHSDSSMYAATSSAAAAYGNYSNIVYDDKNSAVLLTPPNATFDYDNSQC